MHNKIAEKKIRDCFNEINAIKNTLKEKFKPLDQEKEYLTKYILVYISGVLEISYKTIIADYCVKKSNTHLHNFFDTIIIKNSKNATLSNIYEILQNINPTLKKTFRNQINNNIHGEHIKSSLESISTLRNSFAHGILTEKVYMKDIEKYFVQSVKMIIILDKLLCDTNENLIEDNK